MTAAKDISALAFLLLLPSVSYAQARGCDSHTIVVNVRDRHGKFVSSLQASDFRAKLDGKHVTIVSMTQGPAPKRVVIVLDRSGSMSSELRRRSTQSIVSELIRTLPETTQFALVVFGSRIQGTVKFGHSSAEMLSVMDRLTNSAGEGQTALRDALQYAGDIFSPTQVGDSVVAISDGKDNLSKTSLNALKQTYWFEANSPLSSFSNQ
jgi:Mg-chelatase subunit ChlD